MNDDDNLINVPDQPETASVLPIQLTRYIDQVPQHVSLYASMKAGMKALFGRESVQHTIEGIIGRPRQLAPITWTQSQGRGTEIFTLQLPQFLWDESSTIKEKIHNFTYMKATVNVRMALNAMQFHQGRLLLSFDPLRAWRGARSRSSLQYQSGLRHVQIDPTKHQEGVLAVDFSGPISHWDLQLGHYDMGVVFLSVLSPLRTAVSSQTVAITPTVYLTNVELSMPTFGDIWTPQSLSEDVAGAFKTAGSIAGRFDQTGDDEAGLRPISGALSDAGMLAGHIGSAASKILPSYSSPIKSVVGTASWILSYMSKAARWLGFNKPSSYRGAAPVYEVGGWPNHLMDGGSQAIKLTGAQDQSFPIIQDIFGTDVDETDIKYVVSKLNYWYSFDYTETDIGQNVISNFPVHPGACRVVQLDDTFYYDTTHLSYVSSLFRRWSGSIKFRLSCVSTTFHAGRLLVAYVPYTMASVADKPNFSNAWSIVWDISESNDVEFEIPWLSNMPAKHVFLDDESFTVLQTRQTPDLGVDITPDRLAQLISLFSNGQIIITAEGPLIRAEAASDTVEIQVFVGAGSDFELFHPENGNYNPIFQSSIPSRTPVISTAVPNDPPVPPVPGPTFNLNEEEPEEFEVQSNPFYKGTSSTANSMLDQHMRDPSVPFFDVPRKPHLLASSLVAGEKWENLRQLTKRMSLYTGPTTIPAGSALLLDPGEFESRNSTEGVDTPRPSMLDLVAALYAGYRGSIRYFIKLDDGTPDTMAITRIPQTIVGRSPMRPAVQPLTTRYMLSGAPTAIPSMSGAMEIDVPVNGIFPWTVIRSWPNNNRIDSNTPYSVQDMVAIYGEEEMTVRVLRAASDDADFGILVGAPRVVKRNYTLSWTDPFEQVTIHR
jgi:hypothetical protein